MDTSVETPKGHAPHRLTGSWLFPVMLFFVIGCVLAVVVQSSRDHLAPELPRVGPDISDAAYYGGWMQFDTGWYVYIAEHGYDKQQVDSFDAGQQSAVAYFPVYPMTVRQVARFTDHDYVLAAELTTIAAGLATLVLFWHWCGRRLEPSARAVALLLFAMYPYAWFLYGTGYGDALFLAFTMSAFLLVERDRPVLAGVVGAAASATRLIGVGTIIGLVALTIERRHALVRSEADGPRRPWSGWRLDRSRLRPRDAGVLLSGAGIASYAAFLWVRTGDFLAFNTVQAAPGWNQGTGPKTWFKYSFFADVIKGSHSYGLRLVIQSLLCLLFLLAIPLVVKRFGTAYGIYTAIIIGIPLIGSSTFQGFGRYLLGAFPVFAIGGQFLADRIAAGRKTTARVVLGISALGLLVLASFFGRGYYLS